MYLLLPKVFGSVLDKLLNSIKWDPEQQGQVIVLVFFLSFACFLILKFSLKIKLLQLGIGT